jgi:hypothetical protein
MGIFQAYFPSRGIPKHDTPPAVRSGLQRRDRSRFTRDSLLTLSVPSFIKELSYQRPQKTVKHSFAVGTGHGALSIELKFRNSDCGFPIADLKSIDQAVSSQQPVCC